MADQTDSGNPKRQRRVPRTRTSRNATVRDANGNLLPNTRNTRVVLGMNVPDIQMITSGVTLREISPGSPAPSRPRQEAQLPPGATITTGNVHIRGKNDKVGRRVRNRSEAARKAAITRRARGG